LIAEAWCWDLPELGGGGCAAVGAGFGVAAGFEVAAEEEEGRDEDDGEGGWGLPIDGVHGGES
jgi:hypothetical protein